MGGGQVLAAVVRVVVGGVEAVVEDEEVEEVDWGWEVFRRLA
jgi:hypothetical protein